VHEVGFNPNFTNNLYFVYLNQKKNSREAIAAYRKLTIDKNRLVSMIDEITQAILNCHQLSEFERLLTEHEQLLSKTLNIPTVKESQFPDYPNAIKSLGAWGGDFIIATGTATDMSYFQKKGYSTILSYSEMIL
jgi:predicted metal-dependent HD superfamily phosphohydrolase